MASIGPTSSVVSMAPGVSGSVSLIIWLIVFAGVRLARAYVTLQKGTHDIARDTQQFGGAHLIRIAVQIGILNQPAFYVVEQTGPGRFETFS